MTARPPLTSADLADLKAKAKAATPGPWKLKKKHEGVIWHWCVVHDGAQIAEVSSWNLDRDKSARDQAAGNADLITAANPEAILRLIDMIERRDEQIEKLRAALTEISLGRGPFNQDPMKHAENTIEAMKQDAREALAATEPPK